MTEVAVVGAVEHALCICCCSDGWLPWRPASGSSSYHQHLVTGSGNVYRDVFTACRLSAKIGEHWTYNNPILTIKFCSRTDHSLSELSGLEPR